MKIIQQTSQELTLQISRKLTIWVDQRVGWLMVGASVFVLGWLLYALILHQAFSALEIIRFVLFGLVFLSGDG